MSSKFGIQEVRSLVRDSMQLQPEAVGQDFGNSQGHGLTADTLSEGSKRLLSAFAPILEETEFVNLEGHDTRYSKRYETAKKVLAAHGMLNALRRGTKALNQEATTAGVDLPTFTKQLLMTITRAYAQLFTPELFGVIPLSGPTGRIHFKDYKYDSTYTGSTPTITGGTDRPDQVSKFNPGFYQAPEGQAGNKTKYSYSNLDISVSDYRVIAEWTDTLADDSAAVYGDNPDQSLMNQMAQEMARVVDRTMIAAMIAARNTANDYDFTGVPTANPNYAALSPSEKREYDNGLLRIGFNQVMTKIAVTRNYNNDGRPDWAIAGTDMGLALSQLRQFTPYMPTPNEVALGTGALADYGQIGGYALRILVDPMLASTVSGGAAHAYFGRTPRSKDDVGVKYCPFVALQATDKLYNPETGEWVQGTRSRFAVAKPNTGSNAASSQLGDIYGRLRIV